MYKASRILPRISGHQLDQYLAHGWYRMDQRMFTEQFLQDHFHFRNAIWLRQRLKDLEFPKWYQKKRNKSSFRLELTDSKPTAQHEMLYQQYLLRKPKGFPESLEDILYGDYTDNIFNTRMMNVYDGDVLIASGFFDLGEKAAEGIVNFYHPDYGRHQLGKFLYLLAMESCMNAGLDFFYPGYFVPGNPCFDYKTGFHPQSLEFLDPGTRAWLPFSTFHTQDLPLEKMKEQLLELSRLLSAHQRQAPLIHNALYGMTLNNRWDAPLFLLVMNETGESGAGLVCFDTNLKKFLIFSAEHINTGSDIAVKDDIIICLKPAFSGMPLAQAVHMEEALQKALNNVAS